jgi:hypothetical protein
VGFFCFSPGIVRGSLFLPTAAEGFDEADGGGVATTG